MFFLNQTPLLPEPACSFSTRPRWCHYLPERRAVQSRDKKSLSATFPLSIPPLTLDLHYSVEILQLNSLHRTQRPVTMPVTDTMAANMAAKDDIIRKQRDMIAQYLILDIEDVLAEAREKQEKETEERALMAQEAELNKASFTSASYAQSPPCLRPLTLDNA
ncbi:hypothetical protein BDW02DRAFT_221879 [Decorospora gaudefroyi]|uniref:Uncharacterized protein n=1 Tax=Decorospora gaudefroyi TaxID=184978 RepID=A0A6A5KLZ6_9PLEO|nr:hypothetical protein BDW02DRAFT_221879 [Decorospora gaudefroyi]